jgi:hypothetical protein
MANWRYAAAAAALVLAGCMGGAPNQTRPGDGAVSAAPPAQAPAPAPAPAPSVAAPGVEAPPPPAPIPRNDADVVVPGRTQLPPPEGDPRTVAERRADVARWDRCVSQAQNAAEDNPMRPQLDSPEDQCRKALDMSGRFAVPASRRR